MVVFGTRKTAWGHPTKGYGHYTGPILPCTQPHSSAGDTTELLRISKKSRGKKIAAIRTFRGAPGGSAVLATQHTRGFAVSLENRRLLGLERVESPATLFRVL